MLLRKRLESAFLAVIFLFSIVLIYNLYSTHKFNNNPLSQKELDRIQSKEQEVLRNMHNTFGFTQKFPLIITDKIPGKLYGLTSYENGHIKIYLNKKVMRESMDYMVDEVIAHEYAHALLFFLRKSSHEDGGHSKLWQKTCIKLGGIDCKRYVNQHEIIMSKIPFQ